MPAPKGHAKYGGRKKGTPNKVTAKFKEAIEEAFDHLEKDGQGFKAWALANETIFYTQLVPKIIPAQLNVGDNEGGPLQIIINRQG